MEAKDIAIIGAGIGGLIAGLLLVQDGADVHVYEQSPHFSRIGAGIQLGPNVLKILRRLGLEHQVEAAGCKPDAWVSRDGANAAVLARIPLNERRAHYKASYVTIHRGDLHQLLVAVFPSERLHFNHRLTQMQDEGGTVRLDFSGNLVQRANIVIGADGVNSVVRESLLGVESPLYTGYVGHRAIVPSARLRQSGFQFDDCVKWWSRDRHIMAYYLDDRREHMYYVTGAPEPEWSHRTSWVPSSKEEMKATFSDFHPIVQAMIDASEEITKWSLLTRPPLALWSQGRIVMLGDACHPMKPHMAQGAAMAIEDAAMLVRCLGQQGSRGNHEIAFAQYRENRVERATRVQTISNANTWLRSNEDPDWVYGYDVFESPLIAHSAG